MIPSHSGRQKNCGKPFFSWAIVVFFLSLVPSVLAAQTTFCPTGSASGTGTPGATSTTVILSISTPSGAFFVALNTATYPITINTLGEQIFTVNSVLAPGTYTGSLFYSSLCTPLPLSVVINGPGTAPSGSLGFPDVMNPVGSADIYGVRDRCTGQIFDDLTPQVVPRDLDGSPRGFSYCNGQPSGVEQLNINSFVSSHSLGTTLQACEWDGLGRQRATIDDCGNSSTVGATLSFDSIGHKLAERQTLKYYDGRSRLVEVDHLLEGGGISSIAEDTAGENWAVNTVLYDALGRTRTRTLADGELYDYAWDGGAERPVHTAFDANGRWIGRNVTRGDLPALSYERHIDRSHAINLTTRHYYDSRGNELSTSPDTSATVNTSNGNLILYENPLSVPDPGQQGELSALSVYNSEANTIGSFGANWTGPFPMLNLGSTANTITLPDGKTLRFNLTSGAALDTGNFQFTLSPITVTTPTGTATEYVLNDRDGVQTLFDANGRLASKVDRSGNSETIRYDSAGNLSEVDESGGRHLYFTVDSNSHITAIADDLGRAAKFAYDSNNNLISATDPAANVTQFQYSGHLLTAVIDPRGNTVLKVNYDSSKRVAQTQDGLGNKTTFTYNPGATLITDALGNITTHQYDSQGRLSGVVDALSDSSSWVRNNSNLITQLTTPNGKVWNFSYDPGGFPTQLIDPSGHTTTETWDDSHGNPLTLTDANGHTITWKYDTIGNLTGIQNPLSGTASFTRDSRGLVNTATDANGHITSFVHNSFGDLTGIIDALGGKVTLTVDLAGRPTQVTDQLGQTDSYAWDPDNRLVLRVSPLGRKISFYFDQDGNAIRVVDPNLNTTTFSFDADNDLSAVNNAAGGQTSYTVDAVRRLVTLTDPRGNTVQYSYDAANRLVKLTNALDQTEQFSYDADGNETTRVDGNGKTTTYAYDGFDRLTIEQRFDGVTVARAYDAVGNEASLSDPSGTTTYNYDPLNRLIKVVSPEGTVVYNYDPMGNQLSLTLPGGQADTYSYDGLDRLLQAIDNSGAKTIYTYDAASRMIHRSLPNGASTSNGFDADNEITSVVNSTKNRVISQFSYQYDANGNIIRAITSNGVNTYTYDALNRLESTSLFSLPAVTYTFDPGDNRTQVAALGFALDSTYDAANELITNAGGTLSYDPNGNLLQDPFRTFTYDAANELVSVAGLAGSAAYSYDGAGLRIRQITPSGVHIYLNDPLTGLLLVESGSANFSYLYGRERISSLSTGGSHVYYQYDGLGNVASLTDDKGKVLGNYIYDPWGVLVVPAVQTGGGTVFGFAGAPLDPLTGFVFFGGTSYYAPFFGRFTTAGGFALSPNVYEFRGDNPLAP